VSTLQGSKKTARGSPLGVWLFFFFCDRVGHDSRLKPVRVFFSLGWRPPLPPSGKRLHPSFFHGEKQEPLPQEGCSSLFMLGEENPFPPGEGRSISPLPSIVSPSRLQVPPFLLAKGDITRRTASPPLLNLFLRAFFPPQHAAFSFFHETASFPPPPRLPKGLRQPSLPPFLPLPCATEENGSTSEQEKQPPARPVLRFPDCLSHLVKELPLPPPSPKRMKCEGIPPVFLPHDLSPFQRHGSERGEPCAPFFHPGQANLKAGFSFLFAHDEERRQRFPSFFIKGKADEPGPLSLQGSSPQGPPFFLA